MPSEVERVLNKRLNDAVKAIDDAPPEVRNRQTVRAARRALKEVLEDIVNNPGGFEGSMGHTGGGG